jgi:hypothetical protein
MAARMQLEEIEKEGRLVGDIYWSYCSSTEGRNGLDWTGVSR